MNFHKFLQSKFAILLPALMIGTTVSVVMPGAKVTNTAMAQPIGIAPIDGPQQPQAYWANESGGGRGGGHASSSAAPAMAPPRTDD